MTSLSRRKRQITARLRWAANAISPRRLLAGLLSGCITVAAVSAQTQPVEVIPQAPSSTSGNHNWTPVEVVPKAPAENPNAEQSRPVEFRPHAPANGSVTVFYERQPSGELRQVSNLSPQPEPTRHTFTPPPENPSTFQFRPVSSLPTVQECLPAAAQKNTPPINFSPVTNWSPSVNYQPISTRSQSTAELQSSAISSSYNPRSVQPAQPTVTKYQRLSNGSIIPINVVDVTPTIIRTTSLQELPPPSIVPVPAPTPVTIAQAPALTPTPAPAPVTQPPTATIPSSPPGTTGTLADYGIETKPPTLDRLYRLDTEPELQRRINDEIRRRPQKPGELPEPQVEFPTYKPLTDTPYQERQFGGLIKQIEPNYVCHGRLMLEELNAERYGWELGPLQPFVSAGAAWKDMAFLPYKFATRLNQRYDCSAGKCYPGDPVPYLVYPPELSATGAGWEGAVIYLGFILIP